jgi:hypothetical protein
MPSFESIVLLPRSVSAPAIPSPVPLKYWVFYPILIEQVWLLVLRSTAVYEKNLGFVSR